MPAQGNGEEVSNLGEEENGWVDVEMPPPSSGIIIVGPTIYEGKRKGNFSQSQTMYPVIQDDTPVAFSETTSEQKPTDEALNPTIATEEANNASQEAVEVLTFVPQEELGPYLSQLTPQVALTIKDVAFNITNTQYGQVTARLSALRAGASGVALQGLNREPMIAPLRLHEVALRDKRRNPLAYRTPSDFEKENPSWSVFASASGVFSKIATAADLPKLHSMTGCFSAGADRQMNRYANAGVYVGYQGTKAWYEDGSQLRGNGVKYGLYGTAQWNGFYVHTLVGGGNAEYSLRRSIHIKSLHRTACSHLYGGELDSLLGGGYEWNWNAWRFGMDGSLQYTYLGISSFAETGASELNLKVGGQNPSSLLSSLGASVSYLLNVAPHYRILPRVGLSWQREFLNYGQKIAGAFDNGTGTRFQFASAAGARNNVFGAAGITAQLGRRWGAYGYYNPQFGGGDIVSHGLLAGLNCNF